VHSNAFDRFHHGHSLIHEIDPRIKVVVTIAFIVSNALLPDGAWIAFMLAWFFLLIANTLSGLGIGFTFRRSFVALPFALIAITVLFSIPGNPIYTFRVLMWKFTITDMGLLRFVSIVIRSWLSVQMAILLVSVGILGAIARRQYLATVRERQRVEQQALLANSLANLSSNPDLSLLLALEAMETGTEEARPQVVDALRRAADPGEERFDELLRASHERVHGAVVIPVRVDVEEARGIREGLGERRERGLVAPLGDVRNGFEWQRHRL